MTTSLEATTRVHARQDRMPSSIPGLDDILLGGFVQNGLYIVQGRPGSGKTILANQICYAHVAGGGRALYVTLLSEQHERMLAHLSNLSFFDPGCVAHALSYVSAFMTLERDGLAGLLTLLRREIVGHKASMLVIDGLLTAPAHPATVLELKKFVHELQMLSAAGDCTMFLLTSAFEGTSAPEHTMVDGMIEIGVSEFGWRSERDLVVRKFRGSDFLPGHHAMRITGDGIVVWPRTEALYAKPSQDRRDPNAPRLSTGIAGLDDMLHGGLPARSATLLLGPTGVGKTAIGLQFLAGCSREQPGLILGFYEPPEQLFSRAAMLAPKIPALVEAGIVDMLWQSPSEDVIDRVASATIAQVRARGVKRLLVDGLLGFRDMTVQPDRLSAFYRALTNELRSLGVTVLYTMEAPELAGPVLRAPIERLTPVSENLLLLRYVDHYARMKRLIAIMKVRDSRFDPNLREFEIEEGGVVIGPGFQGERGVLTGEPTPVAVHDAAGERDRSPRASPEGA
jgi:circadian clock protein KaiC